MGCCDATSSARIGDVMKLFLTPLRSNACERDGGCIGQHHRSAGRLSNTAWHIGLAKCTEKQIRHTTKIGPSIVHKAAVVISESERRAQANNIPLVHPCLIVSC